MKTASGKGCSFSIFSTEKLPIIVNRTSVYTFIEKDFYFRRQIPKAFQNEIFSRCYVETGPLPGAHLLTEQVLENEDTLHRFVHIMAGSLHKIASGISPNNREVSKFELHTYI